MEGASKLGSTEMQEVPDDASDLAKEYGETHAAIIQDWWLALRKA